MPCTNRELSLGFVCRLAWLCHPTAAGSKAPVVVSRNGEDQTFDVTVGNAPENKVAKANETNGTGRKEALAGVGVTDLRSKHPI
jgi:hypothetical protein